MSWWKWWWEDYNEMYSVPRPRASGDGRAAGEARPRLPDVRRVSLRLHRPVLLFAPGTKVWTMTGRRPIEGIKIGDCVLAQDVESGELAYKPVLGVTHPARRANPSGGPPAGAESFNTTPSHPFWVPGRGSRHRTELEAGTAPPFALGRGAGRADRRPLASQGRAQSAGRLTT